nr:cytochrome P450 [Micromonospora sp. DSM 115978]
TVFDDPDRLDLRRVAPPHVAFGAGPHYCIGAGLARAEIEIGIQTLFARVPTLRLAVPKSELQWKDFAALGGWERVPVTW